MCVFFFPPDLLSLYAATPIGYHGVRIATMIMSTLWQVFIPSQPITSRRRSAQKITNRFQNRSARPKRYGDVAMWRSQPIRSFIENHVFRWVTSDHMIVMTKNLLWNNLFITKNKNTNLVWGNISLRMLNSNQNSFNPYSLTHKILVSLFGA